MGGVREIVKVMKQAVSRIRNTIFFERQCSLAVEHPLSKREVVGSNPAIGFYFLLFAVLEGVSVISMRKSWFWGNGTGQVSAR